MLEDNVLYVDIYKLEHRMNLNNNKSSKIRLYLGKLKEDDEFDRTVESIKLMPDFEQTKVRNYIRSIFNI